MKAQINIEGFGDRLWREWKQLQTGHDVGPALIAITRIINSKIEKGKIEVTLAST